MCDTETLSLASADGSGLNVYPSEFCLIGYTKVLTHFYLERSYSNECWPMCWNSVGERHVALLWTLPKPPIVWAIGSDGEFAA